MAGPLCGPSAAGSGSSLAAEDGSALGVLVIRVPWTLSGGGGDAGERKAEGKRGPQQQGQERAAAEEEEGDEEAAAEAGGEAGLFQNSQRRLGCRFRWR